MNPTASDIAPEGGTCYERIQLLEHELLQRDAELVKVRVQILERERSLNSLRAQIVVQIGTWSARMHGQLSDLVEQVDRTDDCDEMWDLVHQRLLATEPELAQQFIDCADALTPFESKVFLLSGMEMPTVEIAQILHQPVSEIEQHSRRIQEILGSINR